MAINPLLQWLVNTAKTSATVVKKNTETKAKNALWWLVATQKETMPQARAKALLPWLVKVAETTGKVWQANVAKKQEQAKELLGGMTATVNQWFAQAKDTALNDLQADVSAWMPKEELRNFYPDIPENVVEDLYTDLQAGMPIEEAKNFYPEIYSLPKVQPKQTTWDKIMWWISKIAPIISPLAWAVQKIWAKNVLNAWVWALEWAASVWWAIWQWLAYIDPTITVDEYNRWQSNIDATAPQPIQDIRGTQAYWIGKEAGKFAWQTALTYPIWWWAGKLWALAKTAIWAWAWAIQTQASNLINEGKLASASETAIWAGIWWLLWWGAWLLKKAWKSLYNSAFSQAWQWVKKDLAKYWQTAWEAVMEQNLPASVKWGIKVIKEKLGNTRKAIENTADAAGNIKWKSVREWIKTDIINKLWYNKLNQASESTKSLIKNVSEIVDDMIPDSDISPQEVLQQIKQINSTLPNTLISKWFQDLKGNSKIQKVITTWLKDALDKAVEQWWWEAWVIKSLYAQYGKQKTVEKILEDESIRKILWRQLVWWWVWAWVWAIAWYEDIKQWDLIWWLTKVALFSAWWTVAAQLAKNPTFLSRLAKIAEWISKSENILRAWWTALASKKE